jgi:hypothetical protein
VAWPDAEAETIAAIRLELGLDRSIPIQFCEHPAGSAMIEPRYSCRDTDDPGRPEIEHFGNCPCSGLPTLV